MDANQNDGRIDRGVVDDEYLRELAAIEEEALIGVRVNREVADTNQSQVEQTIANMAALRAIRDGDKVTEALLGNPT